MNNKLIQKPHEKSPKPEGILGDAFFLLHSKFSQAECIYKCCPTQPLEMKGLPFPRRHAFYCQGGA